jgi:hypothetical protein
VRIPLKGKSRYGNVKRVKIDGYSFDSKREGDRYLELRLLERAREIKNLVVHPVIKIVIGGVPVMSPSPRYPKGRQMRYVADFAYDADGQLVYEDVKMTKHRTDVYKLKRALVFTMGINILETT